MYKGPEVGEGHICNKPRVQQEIRLEALCGLLHQPPSGFCLHCCLYPKSIPSPEAVMIPLKSKASHAITLLKPCDTSHTPPSHPGLHVPTTLQTCFQVSALALAVPSGLQYSSPGHVHGWLPHILQTCAPISPSQLSLPCLASLNIKPFPSTPALFILLTMFWVSFYHSIYHLLTLCCSPQVIPPSSIILSITHLWITLYIFDHFIHHPPITPSGCAWLLGALDACIQISAGSIWITHWHKAQCHTFSYHWLHLPLHSHL